MDQLTRYQVICQSCGMPMRTDKDYGTKVDGTANYEYCTHCYKNGGFVNPGISMSDMINGCVGIMTQYGMNQAEAQAQMDALIPTLKRWQ